jgi:hypothetical protein
VSVAEIVEVVVSSSLVLALVVAIAKGRWTLILSGLLLLFPLWWYAAITLAAPDSWWSRHFYRGAKLERARVYHDKWSRQFAE